METYLILAAGAESLKSIGNFLTIVGGAMVLVGGVAALVSGKMKLRSGKIIAPAHVRIFGAAAVLIGIILLWVGLYPMLK